MRDHWEIDVGLGMEFGHALSVVEAENRRKRGGRSGEVPL
jgi:hypothetical protein